MQKKHKVPEYLIEDFISIGWKPDFQTIEGNAGCFNKYAGSLLATSFAQLYEPQVGVRSEFRFVPEFRVGATWFKSAYQKISEDKTKYPGFSITPENTSFTTTKYSREFLKETTDELMTWMQELDLNSVLKTTATIPSSQTFPSNSFTYITAHAILGNKKQLERYKLLVLDNETRPLASYVKLEHLNNAIEYCDSSNDSFPFKK